MQEMYLYDKYADLCLSEEEYDLVMEKEYIQKDLRDFFVGKFVRDGKYGYQINDNPKLIDLYHYVSENNISAFHNLDEKEEFNKESTVYFFGRNYLVIVPVERDKNYETNKLKGEVYLEKSKCKPVIIPMFNVIDVDYVPYEYDDEEEHDKDEYEGEIVISYLNEFEEKIKVSSNVPNFTDNTSIENRTYEELIAYMADDIEKAISFDLVESYLLYCFGDYVDEDAFETEKFSLICDGNGDLIDKILSFKDKVQDKDGVLEMLEKYENAKSQYDKTLAKRNELETAIDKANLFGKAQLKKNLSDTNDNLKVLKYSVAREKIKATFALEDKVRNFFNEMSKEESVE